MLTNWTDIRARYGLQQPYDFRIAIPFLLNLIGLIVVFVVCIFLFVNLELNIGTQRFYFFCYLLTLLLIGTIFSRATVLSLSIFFWCAAELGVSFVTNEYGGRLLPANVFTTPRDPRYDYHPVLGMVNKPNSEGEYHLNQRNENLVKQHDWAANPSLFAENIFRHNSLGFRGRELTASDLKKELIFIHGGSTTYDYTVTQGETWVEKLEADLNNKFTIVNFGVVAHSTAQHLIHTAFYHNVFKKKPICAIYYVGWNDLHNFRTPNLDPTYANRLSFIMHYFVRKPDLWAAKYSPLLRLADMAARRRFEIAPKLSWSRDSQSVSSATPDDTYLEQIFIEHIDTITAINAHRGTRTVFIGQIINKEMLQSRPHARDYFVKNEDAWPLQEHFNSILERTAVAAGAKYVDAGVGNFHNGDFSDIGHFSAEGSKKFASLISERVESYCQ